MQIQKQIGLILLAAFTGQTMLFAQAKPEVAPPNIEKEPKAPTPDRPENKAGSKPSLGLLPRIQIIGNDDGLGTIAGSAQVINAETLRQNESDDIHQTLRKVPGVIVKEEDGFGLRPNIGIRGSNPNRSSKILLMEDGIPIAPAPYASPEAYFSPMMGRMHQIEVIKGAGSIKYGPNNISGVINMVSTPIPQQAEGYLKIGMGSNFDLKNHITWGDTLDLGFGKLGYLAESYYNGSKGWQKLDMGGTDPMNTGFERWEPMLKLAFQPNTKMKQVIEAKVGYTEEDSRQSYLGLTADDAKNNPDRRYAASQRDQMLNTQKRSYLKYFIQPSEMLDFTTTAYYNEFARNWFKLQSQAANFTNPTSVARIKGEQDTTATGHFVYRHNNRAYYSYGTEVVSRLHLKGDGWKNDTELGLRYHQDAMRRLQRDERFDMIRGTLVPAGTLTAAQIDASLPGGQENRNEKTTAFSAYLSNDLTLGRTTITPGVRVERLGLNYVEYDLVTTTQPLADQVKFDHSKNLIAVLPGLGVSHKFTDELQVFGGVHQGMTPPGPGNATLSQRNGTQKDIEFEKSMNYELGSRYINNKKGIRAESTFFYNDYANMITQENIGSGTTISANIGEVSVWGAEAMLGYDPGKHNQWSFGLPLSLSVTYTKGKFDKVDETVANAAAVGSSLENVFLNARNGNKLPYLPEIQLTLGAGLLIGKFGINVEGVYFTEAYSDGGNTEANKLPGAVLLNAGGRYFMTEKSEIFVQGRNLTNERYIVSYVPDGARVSRGLNIMAGMSTKF